MRQDCGREEKKRCKPHGCRDRLAKRSRATKRSESDAMIVARHRSDTTKTGTAGPSFEALKGARQWPVTGRSQPPLKHAVHPPLDCRLFLLRHREASLLLPYPHTLDRRLRETSQNCEKSGISRLGFDQPGSSLSRRNDGIRMALSLRFVPRSRRTTNKNNTNT